ncbi:hypothetical protein ACQR3W_21915 [Rhodococcus ruber]|uniref:GIY-YIG domain-containing protein n=1 Tax=Rhodococcus ruber TaxID=1830 RepID=A0A098BLE5_9NOCA|nr:hypothetical protein [Rhodococcus ruber]MCZ4533449.1 hypothetical protein [Rhodococcus ruber]CDZ89022.1 hypothetical protein RHRU231_450189 [Rhodococcus ruber]
MSRDHRTVNKRRTVLYRHFGEDGTLLYIGIAYDPGARWLQHMDKTWWHEVYSTRMEHFPDRESAEAAEKAAIIDERPMWNINFNENVTCPELAPDDVGDGMCYLPADWWPGSGDLEAARRKYTHIDVEECTGMFVEDAIRTNKRRKRWKSAWDARLRADNDFAKRRIADESKSVAPMPKVDRPMRTTKSTGRYTPPPNATRLPADFAPSRDNVAWVVEHCLLIDINESHRKFMEYYPKQVGLRGLRVDWNKTWREWMVRAEGWAEDAREREERAMMD